MRSETSRRQSWFVRHGRLAEWTNAPALNPGSLRAHAFESRAVLQRGRVRRMTWEPTKHGGFRRTGIAQRQSTTQIKWRNEGGSTPPPRTKIRWHEPLGLPECPYVIRWSVETPLGSLRVHHWLASDDPRAVHDHPWWFLTFIIHGGYTDKSPAGDEHLRRGAVRYRRALHRHTVVPDEGGAWTVLLTGRPLRAWGFWLDGKFRKANKWFLTYGHHPCD